MPGPDCSNNPVTQCKYRPYKGIPYLPARSLSAKSCDCDAIFAAPIKCQTRKPRMPYVPTTVERSARQRRIEAIARIQSKQEEKEFRMRSRYPRKYAMASLGIFDLGR